MIELVMISAYIVLLINNTIQERKNRKTIFTLKDTFFCDYFNHSFFIS